MLCPPVRRADSKKRPGVGGACCLRAAGLFFGSRVPSSFLPDEDQGYRLRQHAAPECGFAGANGSGIETG